MSLFEKSYTKPNHIFQETLGDKYKPYYVPSEKYEHCTWHFVGMIPREPDGYNVELYELRMPATFFKLICTNGGTNWEGEPKPNIKISFGSDTAVAANVAVAMAQGMIGIEVI